MTRYITKAEQKRLKAAVAHDPVLTEVVKAMLEKGLRLEEAMQTPGALLAMHRKTFGRACAEPSCRKKFVGIESAKYCSNACRQRAKRARG